MFNTLRGIATLFAVIGTIVSSSGAFAEVGDQVPQNGTSRFIDERSEEDCWADTHHPCDNRNRMPSAPAAPAAPENPLAAGSSEDYCTCMARIANPYDCGHGALVKDLPTCGGLTDNDIADDTPTNRRTHHQPADDGRPTQLGNATIADATQKCKATGNPYCDAYASRCAEKSGNACDNLLEAANKGGGP
ncbi:MAG: hypothetical protein ABL958_12435, partial [Bdellovibrionia bacterium]